MTDQSPAAVGAEKPAHFRIRQGADGSDEVSLYGRPWQTVDPEPVSDDPAVNAVGKLSLRENQAISEDEAHPDHAAVLEYNRLLMNQLRPTFDGIFKASALGRRAADEIAKSTARGRQAADAILKASDPGKRAADEIAKSTARGKRAVDAILKAQGGQRAGALAAQRYLELVTDARPELLTSTLVELPKVDHVMYEAADGFGQRESKPDGLPQFSDVVADLLREQNGLVGKQTETLVGLLDTAQQDARGARAEAAQARKDAQQARRDAKRASIREWIAIGVAVASVVVTAILAIP